MYHLDKPGGPSRSRRQPDLSPAEWGELGNASDSSRVEECPYPVPKTASKSFTNESLPGCSIDHSWISDREREIVGADNV